MIIINDKNDMRALSRKRKSEGKKVALVPTMGALHEGHLALVRLAAEKAGFVVVSIFVNPTQFGPSEDFNSYPRSINEDITKLSSMRVGSVFLPLKEEMYPEGFSTCVSVEGISEGLCGRSRPGHFRGVATVVAKLFNIVEPDMAIFGEKDAQQLAVIRRMVQDLDMDIEIIGHPIVREPDGLAMSSRNRYLSAEDRKNAAALYQSLQKIREEAVKGNTCSYILKEIMEKMIGEIPGAEIDYIEFTDTERLGPVHDVSGGALVALAVKFGSTRLIDNITINSMEDD